MSPVDVAMMGGGAFTQQVKRALGIPFGPDLARRDFLVDAADRVVDVKMAFSSWDNCMKATYCKWPVIAVIAVGSLIVISIVWCLIRRLCCGLACCCSCFQCLKCCGNCCGCCDSPGKRKQKYLDEPYIPPNHGYQTQPPMQTPPVSGAMKPSNYGPPQYAEFDVSRKGGDDALPEMPSWESGSSKHVMVESDELEMKHLTRSPASNTASQMGTESLGPRVSPAGTPTRYGHPPGADFRRPSPGFEAGYGANGYGLDQPGEVHTPGGAAYGYQTHQGYANLRTEPTLPTYHDQPSPMGISGGYGVGRHGTGDSVGRMTPYGADAAARGSPGPRRTPAPRADHQYMPAARASPAPYEQEYGSSGYGNPSYDGRSYPSAHGPSGAAWPSQNQHPYSETGPQSPITNNSGFDFTSGYARPEPSRSPAPEPYPGYRPYQPN